MEHTDTHKSSSSSQDGLDVEFDEASFVGNGELGKEIQRRAFLDYCKQWMKDYKRKGIEKFRLTFSCPEEDRRQEMDSFIRFVIRDGVKILDIDFSDPLWSQETNKIQETSLKLPWFDKHEKLEFLKLYNCNLPVVSKFNKFSALRHISLGWIRLDSGTISDLLSKCPILEVLSFKKCWNIMADFEIIAPNLRDLIIDKFMLPGPDMIRVNATRLRSFKYSGEVTTMLEFRSWGMLEEAELDYELEKEYTSAGDSLCNMLLAIPPVRNLTVCSFMLQTICTGEEPISLSPPLENVAHLKLKTALNRKEFHGITFLLNSCPALELLTIDIVPARIFGDDYEYVYPVEEHVFFTKLSPPIISYKCVNNTLSNIVVNGFKGLPDEILALGYFIKHGKALDTMQIRIPIKRGVESEAIYREKVEELHKYKRSSYPNLALEFLYTD